MFSLRRCAVTVTVSSWPAAGAAASVAAAGAASLLMAAGAAATSSAYAVPIGKTADSASTAALLAHSRLCILDILIMMFPRSLNKIDVTCSANLSPGFLLCGAVAIICLYRPAPSWCGSASGCPPTLGVTGSASLAVVTAAVLAASLGCLINANFQARRQFNSSTLCAARILLSEIFNRQ